MSRFFWILSLLSVLFVGLLISGFNSPEPNTPSSREQLGERLFFDKILSSDRSISCGSCHKPEFAFADHVAFSIGVGRKLTTRNTPSVMNMAMRELFFWDGRAASLEAQVVGPVENPNEMNLPFAVAVSRVRGSKMYQKWFKAIYQKLPDSASIVDCIASFERTLETDQTPNDRWLNDMPGGLNEQQIRGRELFTGTRTKCFDCHFTPDFTSDEFKNIGLFDGKVLTDSGRYKVTGKIEDLGRFKIPGLRNVAVTAPYMHNGMFGTLREVIDYYDDPSSFVHFSINRDTILPARIGLSEQEKQDLEAFLHALTDDRFAGAKKK